MLPVTDEEIVEISAYVEGQAPDLSVTFCQKIYSESVLGHRHDVWDVHTTKDRWWVITNPTNLYSQELFPNMDLAVTFHIGQMLRVPRSEKPSISSGQIEPFTKAFEAMATAHDALGQAHTVSDYQTVGVRCREALLSFTAIAQVSFPWEGDGEKPKKSDFKAWIEHLGKVALAGEANKHRRQLFKTHADAAWNFSSWLTHATSSNWHDAEAAVATTSTVISLCTNASILRLRDVPNECPSCGDHRLTPLRSENPDVDGEIWERLFCTECEWLGKPVQITEEPVPFITRTERPNEGECIIPTVPLRKLVKPEHVNPLEGLDISEILAKMGDEDVRRAYLEFDRDCGDAIDQALAAECKARDIDV